jgi:hypothetical protein
LAPERPALGGIGVTNRRYGIGVDDPSGKRGPWQTDDLDTALLTAALSSLGGMAVVCEFDTENTATLLAVYRDGARE